MKFFVQNNMNNNLKEQDFMYPTFQTRIVASFTDGIFSFVPIILCTIVAQFLPEGKDLDANIRSLLNFIFNLTLFIFPLLYFVILESSKFQGSPGKYFLGIKVVNETGHRITFLQALIRNVVKILSILFMGMGIVFLVVALNEKRQGLHDLLARTVVIEK